MMALKGYWGIQKRGETVARHLSWLRTATGRALLKDEALQVEDALAGIFGDHLLQLGQWGPKNHLIQYSRTRRAMVLGCSALHPGTGHTPSRAATPEVDAVVDSNCLGIYSDSVDAVLLPHILEVSADPHAILREVDRILRPDGHLVILGFNPISWWGLRRTLSRGRFPPGVQHMISERRLRDWLSLLSFSVLRASFYFSTAPIRRGAPQRKAVVPLRQWSGFSGCYILVARKEMFTMTLLRPSWKRRKRLVGGLVNPTTRDAS